MTSIILADDHHLVRHGLKTLLEVEQDFKIVGEASDGLEALKLVENLKPDVLVADVIMGGMNGIDLTRRVVRRSKRTGVIILSMHSDDGYVDKALRAGAKAYVLKSSTSEELVQAIREVAAGHRYLSAPFSEQTIEAYIQKVENKTDPYDTLTNREREVLHLVAQGNTSAEIAARFLISPRTVESHRASMMRKLGLNNQTELFRYAMSRGIISSEKLAR